MLKTVLKWVAWALAAILIVGAIGCVFDFHREICEYNQASKQEDCSLYSILPFSFIQVAKSLNDYGVALTAIATIVIAGFTGTLYRATNESARITSDALALARSEFVATHRPRIVVRFIQGPFVEGGPQFIWVTVANIGVNKATILEWGADLARRKGRNWITPGLQAQHKTIAPIVLVSGQRHVFTVAAKIDYGDQQIFADTFNDLAEFTDKEDLCAVGVVRYADEGNIVRETGFFRVYDRLSEAFIPSKNPEEEYQD